MFVRLAPSLTIATLAVPIVAGLVGTALPAFGCFPALGGDHLTLDPWRSLLATPALGRSVALTLFVGLAATSISLGLAVVTFAAFEGTRAFRLVRRSVSPILSMPHAALAIGLAFLIAPSGWLVRLAVAAGAPIRQPPDLLIVQDRLGFSLTGALILKETAFLFLMILAALPQADSGRVLGVARTLGYRPVAAWLKTVLPRIYPQIRLPILAVLSYSMSVVDVALILGPTTPPPLPIVVLRAMNDPDLSRRFVAAAAAVLQLGLVVAVGVAWTFIERGVAAVARPWLMGGKRSCAEAPIRLAAGGAIVAQAAIVGTLSVALLLWSFADSWRFPDAIPAAFTGRHWLSHVDTLAGLAGTTLAIGLLATAAALLLSIGCLEHEVRFGRRIGRPGLWLLYAPLLVPQIAFLFGFDVLLASVGVGGGLAPVLVAHVLFVLPYVFLSLGDSWRAFDDRYRQIALCLGASPARALMRVRLPMLLRPVVTAAAVGLAVSIGQYLPTLVAGGGRVATLTTEAVSLSAGGDRRIAAVYALLQMLLPALGFALALGLPAYRARNRRGMGAGA